jgi:hypothetical protein
MRYFIIFFEGVEPAKNELDDDITHRGHIGFPHACFPPFRAASAAIGDTYGFDRVIITNIVEVPKEDYDNWILDDESEEQHIEDFE